MIPGVQMDSMDSIVQKQIFQWPIIIQRMWQDLDLRNIYGNMMCTPKVHIFSIARLSFGLTATDALCPETLTQPLVRGKWHL